MIYGKLRTQQVEGDPRWSVLCSSILRKAIRSPQPHQYEQILSRVAQTANEEGDLVAAELEITVRIKRMAVQSPVKPPATFGMSVR